MKPVPLRHRFSSKIVAGLITMLVLVDLPFFFAFLHYYRSQLLESVESSTTSMSRVLTHQLEISVLEGRHHELERVVQGLSGSGDVLNIMVIDANEKVTVSSDPSLLGRTLPRRTEPGCKECHNSVVLKGTTYLKDAQDRPYYRNVNVIQNRPACFSCHTSRSAVNGILVMDFSERALQAQYRASLARLLWMGGIMLILTVAVLYLLLNHLVLRRLKRFADATEQISPTSFGQVTMPGKDEFSQLAAAFNLMSVRLQSAMHEIRGTKEYLENIINHTDDEIIVLDREYHVVIANAAHMRSRLRLGDGSDADAVPELHALETCACTHTFRDGQVHKVMQTLVDRDGGEKHIEVFCSPLKNESGETCQVIEVRRDITERKLLEANLAHSERLISLGLLASGLSHEINNPLASISTFVEGMQRRVISDPTRPDLEGLEHSLALIQREIERAQNVTRRLLILSQKDESVRSLVDLNESLQETVSLVGYEASKRGMDIQVTPAPSLPILKISEAQVRQVFLNLLMNSLQAGHAGGQVRCRTWHADGTAFASIEDDGRGMETRDLNRIFEPFFSRQADGKGTGLGLFICKSIVTSWGGDITVQSRPNQGARFTVGIPVHP